jgi:hypothetical protein
LANAGVDFVPSSTIKEFAVAQIQTPAFSLEPDGDMGIFAAFPVLNSNLPTNVWKAWMVKPTKTALRFQILRPFEFIMSQIS